MLTVPIVHIGGTSQNVLLLQYNTASLKLNEAITALYDASPHGRDYPVDGPNSYSVACAEHEERIAKVRVVLNEIQDIFDRIADQA